MKCEYYFQYTKGWYEIKLDNPKSSMIDWCRKYDSPYKFYICNEDSEIHENGHVFITSKLKSIKFESQEDAMLFALLDW